MSLLWLSVAFAGWLIVAFVFGSIVGRCIRFGTDDLYRERR